MTRIILNGCAGRMGTVISEMAASSENVEITAGCDLKPPEGRAYPVFSEISQFKGAADVVIDFSHPSAFDKVLSFCIEREIPLVMATTGLDADQKSRLKDASGKIPVFYSANMSMGVNLLMELACKAASFTEGMFDIEIVEKHHNRKIDAPSGTALAVADAINKSLETPKTPVYSRHERREKRSGGEIGIHAVRGGSIVGEHTVIFAGNDEIIEIRHEALSRDIFASGALKAAVFMNGKKPGMYSMRDVISQS